jgi:LmbE family N-acetylglucosaminyl deacetylase
MRSLKLSPASGRLKVLCLAAHSDDIEIGAGGTILKLLKDHPGAEFHWVVFSAKGVRRKEAEASANAFLAGAAAKTVILHEFRDGYFPFVGDKIKDAFESLKGTPDPDLVLTHYRADLHQDHRLISDLTWNTFRDHLIWEYEIPKYDGDLGTPNVYVHLDQPLWTTKVRYLQEHFRSQADNQWFTETTFLALARLRGIESNAPAGLAEGFHCRKMVCV